jgi:DNA-binding NtrC family response regulator
VSAITAIAGARVLLVEDEPNMARTLAKILERKGYDVAMAANGQEALGELANGAFQVVVTDLNMPVMDGMQLLRRLQGDPAPPAGERRLLSPPTIVLTGHGSTQAAVEAMKLGAWDYLVKPCNPDELLMTIEQVLRVSDLERENRRLRDVIERSQGFGEMVGQSPAMREIYQAIEALAQNVTTILITGESGTGKELVARSVHTRSSRAEQAFVALNCGAVSDTLLDSQLFGHRRGAFTGAVADHEGVFQAAHGGTLFLDEIADIPAALQVKFLRAIQEREVTPLGTNRPIKVDVRLIAATNRDLAAEVHAGNFRSDLYYRLNVVHVPLPPLRERREDIALLARHYVERYARQFNVAPKTIQPAALARLEAYEWPGNIRELQNVIERCFALAPSGDITIGSLAHLVGLPRGADEAALDFGSTVPSLETTERQLMAAALRQANGNKNQAARLLGIDRQRLYRKLEKYGLE